MEILLLFALVYAWQQGDGDIIAGAQGVADDLLSAVTRGSRITSASYDKSTGVVYANPQELADQVGVSLDVLALSRMLASEEGKADNTTKAAAAWSAVNHATLSGQAISTILLHAVDPNHSGYFGTFTNIDRGSPYYTEDSTGKANRADRYASTALDSYQGDVDIATAVLSGQIQDFTGGADQFDRPGGEKNPDGVAAKRIAAGSEQVAVPGADPGLRFWRRA